MSNKAILIVEDSVDYLDLLSHLFSCEGYTPVCASNGQEALHLLKSASDLPAFILLDLMMPVMDGYAFREEQLRDPRIASIPVVLVTGDDNILAKTKKIGASAHISKPADIEDLLAMAQRFCS